MSRSESLLKRVKKIEIRTRILVEGLIAGAYHSVFKGRGIEFSEVREYSPGDDIRSIDWNVTARMNTPFVKEFIEERDLTVYIIFDMSSSGEFGSTKSKKDAGLEIAASLMFAAMRNNDKVGLAIFTDKVEKFLPPKKGRRHTLRLIRDIVEFQPSSKKTDINASLRYMTKIIKRRSIVFVISDFVSSDFEQAMRILKSKHDVIAVNINDINEEALPDVGYIELEDEETGEQVLVDTSDPVFRRNYSSVIGDHNKGLVRTLNRLGIDIIQLKSHEPFEIPLKKFFHMRARRVAR